MTAGQSQSLRRIDRDRRAMHAVCRRRLENARRTGNFAQAIRRPLLLARLQGMRRAVLDASRALQRDIRVAHHDLSRADDKKDDREILWLLAFLGLPTLYVTTMRNEAEQVANRVGDELRRVARVKFEMVSDSKATTKSASDADLSPTTKPVTVGIERRPALRPTGGDAGRLFPRKAAEWNRVFLPDATLDTWAEAVAYAEFERGRMDAIKVYPAISEALWGYRWSSILDSRTTTGCRLLDGWVAPLEDPWIVSLAPPRHFNCRAAIVPVYQSSELRPPVPQNRPTEATLQRYLAQKEAFVRRLA